MSDSKEAWTLAVMAEALTVQQCRELLETLSQRLREDVSQ